MMAGASLAIQVMSVGCSSGAKSHGPADAAAADQSAETVDAVSAETSPADAIDADDAATSTADATDASAPGEDAAIDVTSPVGCLAPTQAVPGDLYVLLGSPRSTSVATGTGISKWAAITAGMTAFISDPGSAGLGVGLTYFPVIEAGAPVSCALDADCDTFGSCDQRKACVRAATLETNFSSLCDTSTDCPSDQDCEPIQFCGAGYCVSGGPSALCPSSCSLGAGYCHLRDVCDSPAYTTPAVPLATLPGGAAALSASLSARQPSGYSVAGPALTGALTYASQQALAAPDRTRALVLVTDSLPGSFAYDWVNGQTTSGVPRPECDPVQIADIAALLSTAATTAPAIPTYIVGIFSADTVADATPLLNALATAGGTGAATIVDPAQDVAQAVANALGQIRNTVTCR